MIAEFMAQWPLARKPEVVEAYFETFEPQRRFDAIEMGFVLEHVDDPGLIVRRFKQFLKPGGFIGMAVPNARSLHRLIGHEAGLLDDVYKLSAEDRQLGHKRYFDLESFKRLAESEGLTVCRARGIMMKPVTTRQLECSESIARSQAGVVQSRRRLAGDLQRALHRSSDVVITGLVVAGGGFQGLPMLRALRALGARTVVADSLRENPNAYEADAYAVVPPVADREALERALRRLCEEWQVESCFRRPTAICPIVAGLAPELRRSGIVVAASPAGLLEAWADKVVLLEACGRPACPCCRSRAASIAARSFPWIGKPRRGWGSQGIVTAASAAEHAGVVARRCRRPVVLAAEDRVRSRSGRWISPSTKGQVSPLVARERLRTSGGFAVVSRVDARRPSPRSLGAPRCGSPTRGLRRPQRSDPRRAVGCSMGQRRQSCGRGRRPARRSAPA